MNYLTSLSIDSLRKVLNRVGISPREIAVENVEFLFKYSWRVIRDLNLSICFDTGHLLVGYSGEYTIMNFLQRYWDRIVEIHLHYGYVEREIFNNLDQVTIITITVIITSKNSYRG